METFSSLNIIDLVALVILAVSIVFGMLHGLTGELARACGIAAGAATGYHTRWLWQSLAEQNVAAGISRGIFVVVAVLLTALIVSAVVWRVVKRFFRFLLRQPTDCILGIVFGAARGIVIVLFFLWLSGFVAQGKARRYVFHDSAAGRIASLLGVQDEPEGKEENHKSGDES